MNPFDAAVYFCLLVAVVMGFHTGLLRSLATIFGYLAAMPVVVPLVPTLTQFLTERFHLSSAQILLTIFAVFIVIGMVLSALLRRVVSVIVGPQVSLPDRVSGAALGAVRIGLLAVVMVLVFDRIIPPDREPAFLADSRLRPVLSRAGQQGLKSLPPDVEDFIDQIKRGHGL
jgi:membrane protein required for colicin V production